VKKLLLLVLVSLTIGCSSYTHTSYRPKIKSLLAITETGDTVSVSMREFESQKYNTYTRFNYNNNWYWNNWRYDNDWRWRYWMYPQSNIYNNSGIIYTPIISVVKPQPTPPKRPRIKNERVRVNTPRGSNNQPSRTRTTPNVIQRSNGGRSSSGGSRSSSVIRKN
tara:strand:+ start:402 stop:896 length:495 start_codon:yes stop_codon:yes gene_type:complete